MAVKLAGRTLPRSRNDFLLALCEAGEADWLATGDKADLLVLERHGVTRIATAARLAAELGLEGWAARWSRGHQK